MIDKYQLKDIFQKEDLVSYLLGLSKSELAENFGSDCAKMKDFNQRNPHHCYTLFEHCVRACGLIKMESEMDFLLKTAALFHDIGKPMVAKEKQGRFVFYGHAQKSAAIMQPILPKMGFTQEECDYILFWIEHHDDFIPYKDDPEKCFYGCVMINEENMSKYLLKLELSDINQTDMIQRLLQLCFADISSQSEEVYSNGMLINSKSEKLRLLGLIESNLLKLTGL